MNINRKEFMNDLTLLYGFMGQGKSNTLTNVFSYYYRNETSYYSVTNGNLCVIIEKHNENLPKTSFKIEGNTLYQELRKIKAEEIDLFLPYENTLRITSYDSNDNKTEVDFACLNTSNMSDYIMLNEKYLYTASLNHILIPDAFTKALKTCIPYISATDGKLSYIYFYGRKAVSANNNADTAFRP